MTELVQLARDWRLLLLAVLIFGLAPGVILRLAVLAYPTGHARREELLAELYALRFAARPLWVAQQFETAIFEGIPARRRRRRTTTGTVDVSAANVGVSIVAHETVLSIEDEDGDEDLIGPPTLPLL